MGWVGPWVGRREGLLHLAVSWSTVTFLAASLMICAFGAVMGRLPCQRSIMFIQ